MSIIVVYLSETRKTYTTNYPGLWYTRWKLPKWVHYKLSSVTWYTHWMLPQTAHQKELSAIVVKTLTDFLKRYTSKVV